MKAYYPDFAAWSAAPEEFRKWYNAPELDDESREELYSIIGDKDALTEHFGMGRLVFGTGGLRAKMGVGSSMMNVYTVAQATEGVARLIDSLGDEAKKKGVIIGRDSRNNSELFAARSAEVLTAHGIKVYYFDELRPTPMLSAGVRHFGCIAGINITASHNPSMYNGYKLYWSDGAQPTGEVADYVAKFIETSDVFADVPAPAAAHPELIEFVGDEFDEFFIEKVISEQIYPGIIEKNDDKLKIVYTPLNGAGYRIVPEVLHRLGLKYLYPVREQMKPDGNFPGLPKPNPEYPQVFGKGIAIADRVGSDLIVATDPDCDRVGVMARGKDGKFACITGNQMGSLLLDYIFTALEKQNRLPADAYAVKTIVTSEMAAAICEKHNVKLENVLTGFKYIAGVIQDYENSGSGTFMLGYEESYGYMKGSYSRDKDGVVAAMLITEMAAFYAAKNMTLLDALEALYKKYGYYSEYSAEIYDYSLDGAANIAAKMEILRAAEPESLGGSRVVNIRDYKADTSKNVLTGEVTPTGLPKSNVVYWACENGCVVVARPSGTEPKIKFYILAKGSNLKNAQRNAVACTNSLEDILGVKRNSLSK